MFTDLELQDLFGIEGSYMPPNPSSAIAPMPEGIAAAQQTLNPLNAIAPMPEGIAAAQQTPALIPAPVEKRPDDGSRTQPIVTSPPVQSPTPPASGNIVDPMPTAPTEKRPDDGSRTQPIVTTPPTQPPVQEISEIDLLKDRISTTNAPQIDTSDLGNLFANASNISADVAPELNDEIRRYHGDDIAARQELQDIQAAAANQEQGYDDFWANESYELGSDVIQRYNIPQRIPISDTEVWALDPETLKYSKVSLKPKPGQIIGMAAVMLPLAAALTPLAGTITGFGTAGATGVSNAVVSGTVTGLQGGGVGDILRAATLSGLSGYASGLASELSSAQTALDAAQTAGNTAQVAELTNQISSLQSAVNIASNVDNVAQFANIVDQGGDPIQAAISLFGDDIAEFIDIDDTLNQGLTEIFNSDVANALTADGAFTATLLDQAAGRNLGDSLAERYGATVADQLFSGTQNGQAFGLGVVEAVAEYGENGVASDALFNGVKEYVDQGGDAEDIKEFLGELIPNLPDLDVGDGADLGWIEDGLRELGRDFDDSVLQPVKEFLEGMVPDLPDPDLGFIEDGLREAGREFDDNVTQPILDTVEEGASTVNREVIRPVLDTTEELASDVNREVIRPVLDTTEELASDVNREVIRPVLDAAEEGASTVNREFIQPAIDATADTVREIGRDIREAIPDVDLPDVNLPDLPDLPDVDLPDVDLSRLLGLLGGPTSTGIANPGMYTPEETALVELGELFDLDALTLSGALEDEKLKRLNYNQGGIVSHNNVEDLIRLLRG